MIPKTKTGDCSNSNCKAQNVPCVKVGKRLFCIKCRRIDRANAIVKKSQEKLKSKKSKLDQDRSYIVEDLDVFASKYIRRYYSDINGNCECYTCGRKDRWQSLDCGHFIPRQNMSLRWDTRNLRPQCKECNQYKNGNLLMFANKLEKEDPGIIEALETEAREIKKWTREELKHLLIDFRYKIRNLEHKKEAETSTSF